MSMGSRSSSSSSSRVYGTRNTSSKESSSRGGSDMPKTAQTCDPLVATDPGLPCLSRFANHLAHATMPLSMPTGIHAPTAAKCGPNAC
eukprot:531454-Alexandrium_andersonii.AAC.1